MISPPRLDTARIGVYGECTVASRMTTTTTTTTRLAGSVIVRVR